MGQKKVDILQERLVTIGNKHEGQRQTYEGTSNELESKKETWGKDCLRYQDCTLKLQRFEIFGRRCSILQDNVLMWLR